jgi:hypothetical protein
MLQEMDMVVSVTLLVDSLISTDWRPRSLLPFVSVPSDWTFQIGPN